MGRPSATPTTPPSESWASPRWACGRPSSSSCARSRPHRDAPTSRRRRRLRRRPSCLPGACRRRDDRRRGPILCACRRHRRAGRRGLRRRRNHRRRHRDRRRNHHRRHRSRHPHHGGALRADALRSPSGHGRRQPRHSGFRSLSRLLRETPSPRIRNHGVDRSLDQSCAEHAKQCRTQRRGPAAPRRSSTRAGSQRKCSSLSVLAQLRGTPKAGCGGRAPPNSSQKTCGNRGFPLIRRIAPRDQTRYSSWSSRSSRFRKPPNSLAGMRRIRETLRWIGAEWRSARCGGSKMTTSSAREPR